MDMKAFRCPRCAAKIEALLLWPSELVRCVGCDSEFQQSELVELTSLPSPSSEGSTATASGLGVPDIASRVPLVVYSKVKAPPTRVMNGIFWTGFAAWTLLTILAAANELMVTEDWGMALGKMIAAPVMGAIVGGFLMFLAAPVVEWFAPTMDARVGEASRQQPLIAQPGCAHPDATAPRLRTTESITDPATSATASADIRPKLPD